MRPEVLSALPALVEAGTLSAEQAAALAAEARDERISVRAELRLTLYLGVLLVLAGVGLLVRESYASLGPLGLAVLLGLAAAGCLALVVGRAPAFSWGQVASPHLAFDYLLLLGLLLAAADLAFVEWKFTPLGANWPWHLLIVSLVLLAAAVRYDSRVVFSLALSTFAAWRGVSVSRLHELLDAGATLRWNALACGALCVLLGFLLVQSGRKPHFEPVAVHLGWLLAFGALISGLDSRTVAGQLFTLAVVAIGVGLAVHAFRRRRLTLFALAALAAYVGTSYAAVKLFDDGKASCFWFAVTPLPLVIGLVMAARKMRTLGEEG